jgi:hypothetical protein
VLFVNRGEDSRALLTFGTDTVRNVNRAVPRTSLLTFGTTTSLPSAVDVPGQGRFGTSTRRLNSATSTPS